MKQASKSARESLLRCSYISTFRRRRFVAFSFSIHKHPWMQPQPAAALTSHKLCDPRACVDDSIYENFDKFQHFNKRASIWSRLKWMWLLIWIYKSLSSGRYQDFNKKSMNINTIYSGRSDVDVWECAESKKMHAEEERWPPTASIRPFRMGCRIKIQQKMHTVWFYNDLIHIKHSVYLFVYKNNTRKFKKTSEWTLQRKLYINIYTHTLIRLWSEYMGWTCPACVQHARRVPHTCDGFIRFGPCGAFDTEIS